MNFEEIFSFSWAGSGRAGPVCVYSHESFHFYPRNDLFTCPDIKRAAYLGYFLWAYSLLPPYCLECPFPSPHPKGAGSSNSRLGKSAGFEGCMVRDQRRRKQNSFCVIFTCTNLGKKTAYEQDAYILLAHDSCHDTSNFETF